MSFPLTINRSWLLARESGERWITIHGTHVKIDGHQEVASQPRYQHRIVSDPARPHHVIDTHTGETVSKHRFEESAKGSAKEENQYLADNAKKDKEESAAQKRIDARHAKAAEPVKPVAKAEPKAKSPAPKAEPNPKSKEAAASAPNVEHAKAAIEKAAMELGGGQTRKRILLADLRDKLTGVDRATQDKAITEMAMARHLVPYRMDDPLEMTNRDRDAALHTSDDHAAGDRHIIYFLGKNYAQENKATVGKPQSGSADDHIRTAHAAITKMQNGDSSRSVRISELRKQLPGMSREDQDKAITHLATNSYATTMEINDKEEMRPGDAEGALTLPSGSKRHLVYLQPKRLHLSRLSPVWLALCRGDTQCTACADDEAYEPDYSQLPEDWEDGEPIQLDRGGENCGTGAGGFTQGNTCGGNRYGKESGVSTSKTTLGNLKGANAKKTREYTDSKGRHVEEHRTSDGRLFHSVGAKAGGTRRYYQVHGPTKKPKAKEADYPEGEKAKTKGGHAWEHTKSRWLSEHEKSIRDEYAKAGTYNSNGMKHQGYHVSDADKTSMSADQVWARESAKFSDAHKQSIKDAIADGKHVPAEVLKDYPDLKPKDGLKRVSDLAQQSHASVKKDDDLDMGSLVGYQSEGVAAKGTARSPDEQARMDEAGKAAHRRNAEAKVQRGGTEPDITSRMAAVRKKEAWEKPKVGDKVTLPKYTGASGDGKNYGNIKDAEVVKVSPTHVTVRQTNDPASAAMFGPHTDVRIPVDVVQAAQPVPQTPASLVRAKLTGIHGVTEQPDGSVHLHSTSVGGGSQWAPGAASRAGGKTGRTVSSGGGFTDPHHAAAELRANGFSVEPHPSGDGYTVRATPEAIARHHEFNASESKRAAGKEAAKKEAALKYRRERYAAKKEGASLAEFHADHAKRARKAMDEKTAAAFADGYRKVQSQYLSRFNPEWLLSRDGSDGHWVTIDETHVFIGKGGTITKGPHALTGKKPSELGKDPRSHSGNPTTRHTVWKQKDGSHAVADTHRGGRIVGTFASESGAKKVAAQKDAEHEKKSSKDRVSAKPHANLSDEELVNHVDKAASDASAALRKGDEGEHAKHSARLDELTAEQDRREAAKPAAKVTATVAPVAKPATSSPVSAVAPKGKPTEAELHRAVDDAVVDLAPLHQKSDVHHEGGATIGRNKGLLRISEIRDHVAKSLGKEAASPVVLDNHLLRRWSSGNTRLLTASIEGDLSDSERAGSIPDPHPSGVSHIAYLKLDNHLAGNPHLEDRVAKAVKEHNKASTKATTLSRDWLLDRTDVAGKWREVDGHPAHFNSEDEPDKGSLGTLISPAWLAGKRASPASEPIDLYFSLDRSPMKEVPLGLSGFPLEERYKVGNEEVVVPLSYWEKDVLKAGDFEHTGTRRKFQVTRKDLDSIVTNFSRMKAEGVRVPLTKKHKVHANDEVESVGEILSMWRDGDTLKARHVVKGKDNAELANVSDSSVGLHLDWKNDKGHRFGAVVDHNSLTPFPVLAGLGYFRPMAA